MWSNWSTSDFWTSCPHWRNDTLLVTGQTWPHDAFGRGCDAGITCDQWTRLGRSFKCFQQPGLRYVEISGWIEGWLHSAVDERSSGDRRRSRSHGDNEEAADGIEGSGTS